MEKFNLNDLLFKAEFDADSLTSEEKEYLMALVREVRDLPSEIQIEAIGYSIAEMGDELDRAILDLDRKDEEIGDLKADLWAEQERRKKAEKKRKEAEKKAKELSKEVKKRGKTIETAQRRLGTHVRYDLLDLSTLADYVRGDDREYRKLQAISNQEHKARDKEAMSELEEDKKAFEDQKLALIAAYQKEIAGYLKVREYAATLLKENLLSKPLAQKIEKQCNEKIKHCEEKIEKVRSLEYRIEDLTQKKKGVFWKRLTELISVFLVTATIATLLAQCRHDKIKGQEDVELENPARIENVVDKGETITEKTPEKLHDYYEWARKDCTAAKIIADATKGLKGFESIYKKANGLAERFKMLEAKVSALKIDLLHVDVNSTEGSKLFDETYDLWSDSWGIEVLYNDPDLQRLVGFNPTIDIDFYK